MEYEIGSPGKAYTKWAAEMAVGLRTGVPWVMCKQDDAPDPIVSSLLIFFLLPFSSIFLPFACQVPRVSYSLSGVTI
jgi:hypothetical protein